MLNSFDFQLKTKIFFGRNKEEEIGKIISSYGYKNVLVVVGMGSVKRSGLLDKTLKHLEEENIKYYLLEGIRPNPTFDKVKEGIQIARNNNIELILAIGGGSVIDTAKSIAVSVNYEGEPEDFNIKRVVPQNSLPVGVILTISAAGSEMSNSCVIQDDELHIKAGFNSEFNRPLFVIENPELTYSVNKEQTGYGVVDILMHTLERYFQQSNNNEPADRFAEAVIKSVIDAAYVVKDHPNDYEARATLMLMSSFSHNGLTSIGKRFYMPVHQFEHALSGLYPFVAHGAGLAVLWPAWARYYINYDVEKFDLLAKNVFNLYHPDKMVNGLDGINHLCKLFDELGMPKNYKDLGITDVDIPKLVSLLTKNGTRVVDHYIKPADEHVAEEIFKACQ